MAVHKGTNPVLWAFGHSKDARSGNKQRTGQQNKRVFNHLYNPLMYCRRIIPWQNPFRKGNFGFLQMSIKSPLIVNSNLKCTS